MSELPQPAQPLGQSARMGLVQSPIIPVVARWIRECPGTISLGQGVVNYGPPAETADALAQFWEYPAKHKYGPVEGLAELQQALEKKLQVENRIGLGKARRLIVTAGSNMGFMNSILAIADPGDEIVLQTPYYFNHEMAVTMAGCRPVLVSTDAQFQPRPDAIEAALSPRTRAVVTISPNNPTGAVYSEEVLRRINQLCAGRGVYHIHDEAYEYFTYGAAHVSPAAAEGSQSHTISLFSFSKSYGLASWRLGYMVIPEDLSDAVRKIQDTMLICAPLVSQFAGLGALRAGRDYCLRQLAAIASVRDVVWNELQKLGPRCSVPMTHGAFYFLLQINAPLDPLDLCQRLIREHGVAVIPGTAFGILEGCYLRVAYAALPPETAREGIGRLVEGLSAVVKS